MQLITESESELAERIAELEMISLRGGEETQQLIIKQKEIMPIVIDIRKDLRFKQGIEATTERNTAFVIYLLQNTNHSIKEIANLVNVSTEFVISIKENLK